MAYNMGVERLGLFAPTPATDGTEPPLITGPSYGGKLGFGAYYPTSGTHQWSPLFPEFISPSVYVSEKYLLEEGLARTTVVGFGQGSITFVGYADGWYYGHGGPNASNEKYYFFKGIDPQNTFYLTNLARDPSSDSLAFIKGSAYLVKYTSTTTYYDITVYKFTPEATTKYTTVRSFRVQKTILTSANNLKIVHIFDDGKMLFSRTITASSTSGLRLFFYIADPSTGTFTEATDFEQVLVNSGFSFIESISNGSIQYKYMAILDNKMWIAGRMSKAVLGVTTVTYRFALVTVPSLATDTDFHLTSSIYWGTCDLSELEPAENPGSLADFNAMRGGIPTLSTGELIVVRTNSQANPPKWGATKISLGPLPPTPPEPSDDPYQEEGGISDYGGGGGGIDMTESDDIGFSPTPSNLIADCGLISFYNPTKQEVISLADQIMSQSIAGAIKNIFTDPLEGIVSLALFNGTPPLSGSRGEIKVGLIGTGVTANLLSSSYMTLDCGSITVGDKTKGNALDFSPYTSAQLYLPFIGFATVSPDDFMYGTVNIKYNIDLLSGACLAMVRIQKDNKNDLLYTYSGNVLTSIPLCGKNYKETLKALATIGAAVAVGGITGGVAAGAATGALSAAAQSGGEAIMNQINTAGVSVASKPSITRSGRLDMAMGALSPKKPYLVFSRPAQSLPEKFKSYRGYPSNVTTKLSEIVGYTEVQDVHLTGIPATTEELDRILELLKGGIII